jgi:hypothetical protein
MDNKELEKERDLIIKGLEESYERLVRFKKANNSPLVISKNGKVVEIPPEDIPPRTTYKRERGS